MRSPAPRPAHRSFADHSINIYVLVRPDALIFSVFLFYSFWIFSFSYSLLFLLSFSISSYPSLLISSYSSHRCYSSSSYSSLLILLFLYFKLFVVLQTCILMIHISTVFVHISVILRGFSKRPSLFNLLILLYCIIFFLFLVFFSSYNLTVCCRENSAKIPVWQKSAKV
jgi:hypothetical protein